MKLIRKAVKRFYQYLDHFAWARHSYNEGNRPYCFLFHSGDTVIRTREIGTISFCSTQLAKNRQIRQHGDVICMKIVNLTKFLHMYHFRYCLHFWKCSNFTQFNINRFFAEILGMHAFSRKVVITKPY